MSLIDQLSSLLKGDTLSKISNEVGADENTTSNAIALALPTILAGLSHNAQTPDGEQALNQALDDDHDGSLLDNVTSMLGGQGNNPSVSRALNGDGILNHILGSRRAPAEQSIGQASGLNMQQAGRLMMMVAPLVMAYLGRRKREQNANSVGPVLQHEESEMERRIPGVGGILGKILGGHSLDPSHSGILGGLLRQVQG